MRLLIALALAAALLGDGRATCRKRGKPGRRVTMRIG
jgi:hypothetical protein